VDGNGNVGIGTTFSGSKLVVNGNASIGYPTTAAPTNGLIVSGNVGIGVANPDVKLYVNGDINIERGNKLQFAAGTAKRAYIQSNIYNELMFGSDEAGEYMRMRNNGFIGINNTNPQFPLEVNGYAMSPTIASAYFGTGGGVSSTQNYTVSIKAQYSVWTTNVFVVSSDTRIKTNIQDINEETALLQLRLLQPKTYEYIDKVQKGSDPVIGFIAQEVVEVLPYAVSKQKEIIPSVYAVASVVDGTLQLEKEHDLSVGDKIKLIKEEGGELITTVKEVINAYSFTIQDTIDDKRIFVYGKEVPDFHTLDKNAIFTIGVAAVQELDRQLQYLKLRFASFEERLVALERLSN
jgi:hypothetical protein